MTTGTNDAVRAARVRRGDGGPLAPAQGAAVAVRGLTKSFGRTAVLAGVDLDIPARSLTAVLGPSGCGKTTLLRLLAGFDSPDAGTISFDGRPVVGPRVDVPAQRRRVGYVPQEGALFPHLDVAANVTFGLPRRSRRSSRIVGELLELVGLAATLTRRFPHELSGGQQQRVALARALAPRPSLVLLDEPFSSLDAGLREGTGRAVRAALAAAAATALLVTHDQGEALSLADQVAVMRDGRLVQVDAPHVLYQRPVDTAVGQFVGAAVVLAADVAGARARCALGEVDVRPPAPPGSTRVLVRPEQIRIFPEDRSARWSHVPVVDPTGAGRPAGPAVPARVVDVSYYGHDAAVRLDLLDSGIRVVARVIGTRPPDPGDAVRLVVEGSVTGFV